MNDSLTFFRDRSLGQGKEWRIHLRYGKGAGLLVFYSCHPVQASFYAETLSATDPSAHAAHKAKLRESIRQSGGGLLVEMRLGEGHKQVEVNKVGQAGRYEPPQTVFYIEYGGDLQECPFIGDGAVLSLAQDAHLILPVDAEAESRFRSFREQYSSWFPADFETSLFNLLRRPSLDLRIDRLERILAVTDGQEDAGGRIDPAAGQPLSTLSWLGYGILGLCLLSSLAYPYFQGETGPVPASIQPEDSTSLAAADTKATDAPSEAEKSPAAPPSTVPGQELPGNGQMDGSAQGLAGAVGALLDSLQANAALDGRLLKIDSQYFRQGGKPPDEAAADALLADKTFLWGLLKLHLLVAALESKLALSSGKFLDSVQEWGATAKAYGEVYKAGAFKADAELPCWLEFLLSQIEPAGGKPGKLRPKFVEAAPPLFNAKTCAPVTTRQAPAHIARLAARLDGLKAK